MSRRSLVLASICALGALAHAAGAAPAIGPDAARFAIVIGNNRPETARAGVLRFADDDALATHRLLTEAGVRSVLLARLDDTTQQLHPGAATDGLPRWDDLRAALAGLEREMLRERATNREVELLVFYSGHGDVERGEGYVLLEDRHLTRGDLAEILERSPATRNHVIIDACKSYFMAFEKGPGGRRTRFTGGFFDRAAVTARHLANTGFVLSTSSDRDSHEWERFGGGVFSHQVRSALRGAADADHDGRISYAELGAFLTTASATIPNPRFRPDFLVRPPTGAADQLSDTLLRWDSRAVTTLMLDRPEGHVYIETSTGERVLDAHTGPDEPATLHVPGSRPLFVRSDDGSGHESVVWTDGSVVVSELEDRPVSVARRGAAHLAFEQLFSLPFGRESVRRFVAQWTDEPARVVDPRDDDPPGEHDAGSRFDRAGRNRGGVRRACGRGLGGDARTLRGWQVDASGRARSHQPDAAAARHRDRDPGSGGGRIRRRVARRAPVVDRATPTRRRHPGGRLAIRGRPIRGRDPDDRARLVTMQTRPNLLAARALSSDMLGANLRILAPAVLLLTVLAACKLSLDDAACPCATGWVCCADRNVCVREDTGQCAAGSDAGTASDAGTDPMAFQRLDLDDAAPADQFGASVALAGGLAAIGIPGRGTAASGAGAVAVFERRGSGHGVWVRLPEVVAPDPSDRAGFGTTVAFAAGALLVGAPGVASGRVYVYRRAADGWAWAQTIEPDTTGVPDGKLASLGFGSAMAADQDRVIIATAGSSAHVYQIAGDGAVHLARVDPPGPLAADEPQFGSDVAIHGSTVAVSSVDPSSQLVTVHTFDEAQGWARVTLATDLASGAGLGVHVAFDGQRLAVADGPTVSIWARAAGDWTAAQDVRLDSTALGPMDLAWRGDDLMMTSYRPTAKEPFGLQAFTLVGGSWQSGPITTGIGTRGPGRITTTLAVGDDWALVGAPSSPVVGTEAGAATFVRMGGEVVAELRPVTLDEGRLGTRLAVGGAQLLTDGPAVGANSGGSLSWFGKDAGGQYRRRPSLTAGDLRFGEVAAVAGRHAMVSAVNPEFGVQTFELGDHDWIAGDRLTAPEAPGFGIAIAMDGDTAVIASQLATAFVYHWTTAGWTLSATLQPPADSCSSLRVSLSGTRILVGCSGAGQLWMFQDGPAGWQPMPAPSLPEPVAPGGMVRSLVAGDRIALSTIAQADHHGVSYVFRWVDDSWKLEFTRRTDAAVTAVNGCSAGNASCGFGVLALSGDRLILAGSAGAVTGYRVGDTGWIEDRSFVLPPGERPVETVVQLVALADDQVVVAVPDEAGRNLLRAGALYVFPWRPGIGGAGVDRAR